MNRGCRPFFFLHHLSIFDISTDRHEIAFYLYLFTNYPLETRTMRKPVFFVSTIAAICWSFTQPLVAQTEFASVDAYAGRLQIRGNDIEQLTDTLTAPFSTDLEKARAIFVWIGQNIAYDCGGENRLEREPEEATEPLYYTQVQLENILKTRRTRCDGYAFMFRLMCRLSGIYCTVEEGFARFAGEKVDPATVKPNHAWNAACLDGEWYEIDVSAGSGGCDGRRFRARRDEAYFRMSPALLERQYIPIDDHRHSRNQGRIILKLKY